MKSLTTTFNGVLANDGAMFDIRAAPNKSVTIKSLSFHTTFVAACDVQVFTKSGSHEYFEQTRNAWTEIVNQKTQCMGPGIETTIYDGMFIDSTELSINEGEERSFYIRLVGTELVYSETISYDQVFVEDSNIQILEGVGVSSFFHDYTVKRMWNGVVYYEVIDGSDADDLGSCSSILEVDRSNAGSSNKNFGIMFNIKNKTGEEISIQGLSFYTDMTKNVKYTIYTIPYGYENGMESLNVWRNIAQGTVKGKGEFSPIVISGNDFDAVDISASNTQGFFITLSNKGLLYRTTSLSPGSTYVRNDDIIVSVGLGVGEPSPPLGNTFYESRGLHGRVLYGAKNACRVDTKTTLNFIVYHPNDWSSNTLFDTMALSLETVIYEVLEADVQIIEPDDSLEMIDVEVIKDSSASCK